MSIEKRLEHHVKIAQGAIVIAEYDNSSLIFRYGVGLVIRTKTYEERVTLRGMGCYDIGDGTRKIDKKIEAVVRRFAQEYDDYVELERAMNIALDAIRDNKLKQNAL
jgi:hypothetical protein